MELVSSRFTPKRVLRRAAELGVHADCVAADADGACDYCVEIMHGIFSEFYGHAESAAEYLSMIMHDLRDEQEN